MEKPTSEALSHFQSVDWGAIGKELFAFAEWRAQNYRWQNGTDVLPRGQTLEDVVQGIIVKTLTGKRRWDSERGPLLPWLKDQVKSELDALVRSAAHRREILSGASFEENEMVELIEHRAASTGILHDAQSMNPEMIIIERENMQNMEDTIAKLFEAVQGQPELEDVLQAVMDGCESKPRFLADALGVPVEDIYNRLKRLRRRAIDIKDNQNGRR